MSRRNEPCGNADAGIKAIGEYLAMYPPAGFADRYSAEGWSAIARAVFSAAAVFAPGGFAAARDPRAPETTEQ